MPNLTALLGLVIGLISLFVSAALGVKLIAVYLLVTGILTLIASSNSEVLPPAPRRARAPKAPAPVAEEEAEPSASFPVDPADAYRTFTPEEISASRPVRRHSSSTAAPAASSKRRRSARAEATEDEDEE